MKYRGETIIVQIGAAATRYQWRGCGLTLLPAIKAIIDYHLDKHEPIASREEFGLTYFRRANSGPHNGA